MMFIYLVYINDKLVAQCTTWSAMNAVKRLYDTQRIEPSDDFSHHIKVMDESHRQFRVTVDRL